MASWSPPIPALIYGAILLASALAFLIFGGIARLRSLFQPQSHIPSPSLNIATLPMLIGASLLGLCAWLATPLLPGTALAVGIVLTTLSGQKPLILWGLHRSHPLRDLGFSLATMLTLFFPILFLLLLSTGFYLALHLPFEPQPAMTRFLEARDAKTLLPFLTYALIIAPIWEEIFFRGTLFPWLTSRFSITTAQWLSALAFGAVHLHGPTLIPLTLLGAALAGVYRTKNSLVPSILLHSLFNANTCILLLLSRPPLP